MDKTKICFIRARQKKDYVVPGIQMSGFKVVIPYRDYNLALRIGRELWFRSKMPKKSLWINPEVDKISEEIIIVKDPLIVPEFMHYLRLKHPGKTIIFDYDNRVSNSIHPDTIKPFVDQIWHYDGDDCKKYGLKYKSPAFLDVYQVKPDPVPEYDILYVGRDKGRLNQINTIKSRLDEEGLKTYFHICANREFLAWTNKQYKHFLPYEDYLRLLRKSRAILNVVPEGQMSITQRELEVIFDGVKCITNNKGVLDFELYDESRYFLLEDNYTEILEFLNLPFREIEEKTLSKYRFESHIYKMLQEHE